MVVSNSNIILYADKLTMFNLMLSTASGLHGLNIPQPIRSNICSPVWKDTYTRHNAAVKVNTALSDFFSDAEFSVLQGLVRPENLLVFKVGEGWERLCEFLGQEVPDLEFPHENKAGTKTNIATKYNTFDVFQRGNKEARRSLMKLCATVSIVLIGTFAFKKRSLLPSFVWK